MNPENRVVVIYYSGHGGVRKGDKLYEQQIICVDGLTVSLRSVRNLPHFRKCRLIFIMDCCRTEITEFDSSPSIISQSGSRCGLEAKGNLEIGSFGTDNTESNFTFIAYASNEGRAVYVSSRDGSP
eukprot:UN17989